MKKVDQQRVMAKLLELALSLGVEMKDERLMLYLQDLNDIEPGTLLEAITSVRRSWKYPHFPNIADFREAAGSMECGNPLEDKAIRVFEELCRYSGTNDPIGKRAWRLIAPNGYIDDFNKVGDFKRKSFIELYLKFTASQQREELEDRTIPKVEANAIMKRIGDGLCQMS